MTELKSVAIEKLNKQDKRKIAELNSEYNVNNYQKNPFAKNTANWILNTDQIIEIYQMHKFINSTLKSVQKYASKVLHHKFYFRVSEPCSWISAPMMILPYFTEIKFSDQYILPEDEEEQAISYDNYKENYSGSVYLNLKSDSRSYNNWYDMQKDTECKLPTHEINFYDLRAVRNQVIKAVADELCNLTLKQWNDFYEDDIDNDLSASEFNSEIIKRQKQFYAVKQIGIIFQNLLYRQDKKWKYDFVTNGDKLHNSVKYFMYADVITDLDYELAVLQSDKTPAWGDDASTVSYKANEEEAGNLTNALNLIQQMMNNTTGSKSAKYIVKILRYRDPLLWLTKVVDYVYSYPSGFNNKEEDYARLWSNFKPLKLNPEENKEHQQALKITRKVIKSLKNK